ncbi:two-component system, sporulation sensor kinase E [Paenibacillus tianmuensis]|uniref:histidine kinase n=1 Tax=Paenibacillus tianmuensis TaxID=624147 RepID=A0A1G4SKD5_9BACL|nr:PAS domain-containing sensor histidine kinase [Paenibacillus tianmuensis]SCW69684.1 two-component system, sporulation sensor kinase E [Paenibacillus tianmuensis]
MNDLLASPSVPEQLKTTADGTFSRMFVDLALKSFASPHTGSLLLDQDCNMLMASESLGKKLGYRTEELERMNLQALVHPGELLLCMHHMSQLVSGQLSRYETEIRWLSADGQPLWMNVYAVELKDGSDGPAYIYMQTQNITAQKVAESALQESLIRMTSLLETFADAYIMLNRSGELVYVNRNAEQLLQLRREELLGHGIRGMASEWLGAGFYKACWRAIEEAVPVFYQGYYPLVKKWLEVSCYPCKPGLSVFIRDITRHKEQEETLRATKQQLDSMIEYAADTIAILDADLRLTKVNKAFIDLFGYSEAELIGERPPNVPEELWIESELLFRKALQGKQISSYETKRMRKDGTPLDISLTISPVVGKDQDITGVFIIGRDISESKATEELLRNSEKLSVAGQLAVGIAHEIRNPLTSLKGFTQFMKTAGHYKEQYLDIMSSELTRIEHIISEMLLLAKPRAAIFHYKQIGPILADVLSLLEAQANLNSVHFKTWIKPDLPAVRCEENQLKQLFINIVKNAVEAMPLGGTVEIVAVLADPGTLAITFRDEGDGIPAELLLRISEPFYTTKENGSGLGLMVSQKIVTEHKGRMAITSEAGVGTTVTVTLPV